MPAVDEPVTVVDAACAYVAATPSPLALIPLEDLLGVIEQPNVPGTIDEHPNWRRRLPVVAAAAFEDSLIADRMKRIAAMRRSA